MATPNIVPRADSEGNLGTSSKFWLRSYLDGLTIGNNTAGTIVFGPESGDTVTLASAASGAFSITTVDGGGAAGHIELAADGDITLDAAGQIYFEADTARFVSDQANDPLVIIQGEVLGDATGPRLRFNKKRSDPGIDGDSCGILQWQSYNDGTPNSQLYGQIETKIADA